MLEIFVGRKLSVFGLIVMLFVPVYASAQTSDRIVLLENFGEFDKGENLFIFGQIANLADDSYLILEIINPEGDLCQIQQLTPLSEGTFFTDAIPLKGRICGLSGEYEIKLFYGDYSKHSGFSVTTNTFNSPSQDELTASARNLVLNQKNILNSQYGFEIPFDNRINEAQTVIDFKNIFVDMWSEFFLNDLLFEINPTIRPAVHSSLDSISALIDSGDLSFDIGKSIENSIFSAVFYYEIGDSKKSIDLLSDVFVDIKNATPEKLSVKHIPTFDELEETLLNLMKKSDTVMSRAVKEQIGFIFSRGTAPLYSDQLSELLELLSQARYLDVVSRKQSDLYRLVNNEWDSLKPSLETKENIAELLESKEKISNIHNAAIIIRDLDNVDRFIDSESDNNYELANLILPDWKALESKLSLATSIQDIISLENDIKKMKQVIDISSRLSKSIEISKSSNINSVIVEEWEALLERVKQANTVDDVLQIVSEFDNSMHELREKRNPLNILKFEYQKMKERAELQADYQSLFLINNALKIIQTAEDMQNGTPSTSRIDRIEVLLTWASQQAPEIQSKLDTYDKDAYQIRASGILQRAKSIENLVELGLRSNKFLPGYVEYADSLNEQLDEVRDLVIKNDLDAADVMVRNLFAEWRQVSQAYEDDPYGSNVGYSPDELKRIELRKKLEENSNLVSTFYHSGFSPYSAEYDDLTEKAYELIDYGNFLDAEQTITKIRKYLSEHLAMENPKIIYDISFDPEKNIWIIEGTVDKPVHDRRENLYVTIFEMDGSTHSSLEFTDTKHGDFYTQWIAPTTPGLYVVTLQYQDSKATQIVHVEENFDSVYDASDLNMVELARDFDELKSFMERFGGQKYQSNPRFSSVLHDIKTGLANDDAEIVGEKLDELKHIIERYLPTRLRNAVIEAEYNDDKLIVSGAVQKTLAFREDLFVDIFDQQGNLVYEIALKDNSSGLFNEVLYKPLPSGVYVAQLQYHDVTVNDFFNVR